jgi:hypothetical protein
MRPIQPYREAGSIETIMSHIHRMVVRNRAFKLKFTVFGFLIRRTKLIGQRTFFASSASF